MRFRTLEIRWHDSKPISSCDFQPIPSIKKSRPADAQSERWASQAYRLATAGEDNHVRIWMVHPNIRPSLATTESEEPTTGPVPAPPPPRIEYLATLSRHSAPVNVVRWSPNGELIASAGDDGMIIIWSPSSTPQPSTYGSDLSAEDLQHEKEFWRVRCMARCTTMQVYDLAWSPSGEYIIAGSTDNVARIYQAADGKCVHEIAEHKHYVQGVSWDPMNEYVATQSSDKSMHVYKIITPNSSGNKHGVFEAHAIGRNTNMSLNLGGSQRSGRRHTRTSSTVSEGRPVRAASRPGLLRRESAASDAESSVSEQLSKDEPLSALFSTSSSSKDAAPLTPATSVASTPSFPPSAFNSSMFPPPPLDKEKQSSSRRSSFSGSNAPPSPSHSVRSMNSRYGRSPSPMPALPAIRTAVPSTGTYSGDRWRQIGLYGDESYSNFFRRLAFSPDGGLLVTPAGHFEDPEIILPGLTRPPSEETPQRGRAMRPTISTDLSLGNTPAVEKNDKANSCVYIYTRANLARPPVAQLPGYKKPSVAVKFNPLLFNLRPSVSFSGSTASLRQEHEHKASETKVAVLEKVGEGSMDVDIVGPLQEDPSASTTPASQRVANSRPGSQSQYGGNTIAAPVPQVPGSISSSLISSPAVSPVDQMRPPTPASSKPSTPIRLASTPLPASANLGAGTLTTGSVFLLPYRMLFAVLTMDTIAIYDTQQSGPICMLTKLHYDEFTDVTWSPDGQCLVLSSRDGYCTLIVLDEILPVYHTQQQSLQLQSIAHNHSVPLACPTPNSSSRNVEHVAVTPLATPVFGSAGLPSFVAGPSATPLNTKKSGAGEPPLTPATSIDGEAVTMHSVSSIHPDPDSAPKHERDEAGAEEAANEPAKKKRRLVLTRVSDLGS